MLLVRPRQGQDHLFPTEAFLLKPLITTWFSNSYEQAAVGIKQDLRLLAGSPVVGEAGEALHQAPVIRLAALYHGPTTVPGFCTRGRTTQRSPY